MVHHAVDCQVWSVKKILNSPPHFSQVFRLCESGGSFFFLISSRTPANAFTYAFSSSTTNLALSLLKRLHDCPLLALFWHAGWILALFFLDQNFDILTTNSWLLNFRHSVTNFDN